MRKTGLLVMALVLALGTLGVGYAAWTDTITIDGTVNTGDVDLVIVKYSGTEVWKTDPEVAGVEDDIEVLSGWLPLAGSPPLGAIDAFPNSGGDPDPVATAIAEAGTNTADITVTFENLFPCVDFVADFLLHYDGSIPVKISLADILITGIPAADATISYAFYESNANGDEVALIGSEAVVGTQLHQCDYILVKIVIHVTQDETGANMNASGTIDGTITVKQWNEA